MSPPPVTTVLRCPAAMSPVSRGGLTAALLSAATVVGGVALVVPTMPAAATTGCAHCAAAPAGADVRAEGFVVSEAQFNQCNGGNPGQVQSRINNYQSFVQILGTTPGDNLSC